MKYGIILLTAAGLLSGCASSGVGTLASNANSNFAAGGVALTAEPVMPDVGSQQYPNFASGSEMASVVTSGREVMMPGQGANGMPQSVNSLPVGAADMP